MENDYDAIVIGSGLGGLTAGALYARAGYRVLVLEQNDRFGGAATTYHRGAMTIEASLHETASPQALADPKGEIFAALDLYQDIELVPVGDFQEVRCPLIGKQAVLRDYINATIGFEELSEVFGKSSKSLMRMFGPKGNPQAGNLFAVIGYLQEKEGIHLEVKARKIA